MPPLSSVSRQDRSRKEESEGTLEGDEPDGSEGGMKRRLKNRNAARKSRKKQTEIADELHEEMQHLERSNAALLKEIGQLKKDVQVYETMLKNHEPFCSIRESESADPHDSPSPQDASSSSQDTGLPSDLIDIANEHLFDFAKLPQDCGVPFLDSEGGLHGSFSTEVSGPFPPTESNNPTFNFLSSLLTTQAPSPNSMLSLPTHSYTQQSSNTLHQPSNDLTTNFPFDHRHASQCFLTKTQHFNPEPSIPQLSAPLQALSCPTQGPSPRLSSSEAQPQVPEDPPFHCAMDLGHTSI
ncbi:uncharacterized protein batf2 [Neosynchiropus ocellatus]